MSRSVNVFSFLNCCFCVAFSLTNTLVAFLHPKWLPEWLPSFIPVKPSYFIWYITLNLFLFIVCLVNLVLDLRKLDDRWAGCASLQGRNLPPDHTDGRKI
jgi:hypothetical protein